MYIYLLLRDDMHIILYPSSFHPQIRKNSQKQILNHKGTIISYHSVNIFFVNRKNRVRCAVFVEIENLVVFAADGRVYDLQHAATDGTIRVSGSLLTSNLRDHTFKAT